MTQRTDVTRTASTSHKWFSMDTRSTASLRTTSELHRDSARAILRRVSVWLPWPAWDDPDSDAGSTECDECRRISHDDDDDVTGPDGLPLSSPRSSFLAFLFSSCGAPVPLGVENLSWVFGQFGSSVGVDTFFDKLVMVDGV